MLDLGILESVKIAAGRFQLRIDSADRCQRLYRFLRYRGVPPTAIKVIKSLKSVSGIAKIGPWQFRPPISDFPDPGSQYPALLIYCPSRLWGTRQVRRATRKVRGRCLRRPHHPGFRLRGSAGTRGLGSGARWLGPGPAGFPANPGWFPRNCGSVPLEGLKHKFSFDKLS